MVFLLYMRYFLPIQVAGPAYDVLRRLAAEKYELCVGGNVQVIVPETPSLDIILIWRDSGMIWRLPSDDAGDFKRHISPGDVLDKALSRFSLRNRQRLLQ